jgi:hypothetical protein
MPQQAAGRRSLSSISEGLRSSANIPEDAVPIYQPDRLEKYNDRFLAVAQELFDRVWQKIPEQAKPHMGSFSISGDTINDTAVKLVIYDPQIGRSSADWPRMSDGVYVWVRANGPIGRYIWDDIMPAELPPMFRRLRRDETVQIAPNPQADFAYFPVMAGDNLDEIATLIVRCSRA